MHIASLVPLYIGVDRGIDAADPVRTDVASVVIAAAWALTAWSLFVFRSWRLRAMLDPGHGLMTTGPFGLVRHPIYSAQMLLCVGLVIFAPAPATVAGLALNVLGGVLRANAEERVVRMAFPDAYADYARRVRRFIPFVY